MLKLAALDEEDLAIIGLHLYQARMNPAEIIWQAEAKRFLAPLCRFDWETALAGAVAELSPQLKVEFAKICAAEGAQSYLGAEAAAAGMKAGMGEAAAMAEAEAGEAAARAKEAAEAARDCRYSAF